MKLFTEKDVKSTSSPITGLQDFSAGGINTKPSFWIKFYSNPDKFTRNELIALHSELWDTQRKTYSKLRAVQINVIKQILRQSKEA